MLSLKITPALFLALSIFLSCQSDTKNTEVSMRNDWHNGVMYEIFVQSYADSDGDGIGDFKGLTSKLDYIKELGIQGIWLMPISPSPSYHKYDVTDYYGIHPDYGTMDDFKEFLKEAHKRDIKIIIDLVINHTSSEHPWFLEAKKGKENKFRDYYVWANIDSVRGQIAKKVITLDSDNITQWHQNARLPDGQGEDDEYYYGFFWGGMPDLNFDNPEVRAEIIKIGSYWLADVGVDGLRLDAAKHIFPDDRLEDSHEWWIEFGDAMRQVKPDVYMVGEVWGANSVVAPFMKGLHSMFNFPLYHAINDLMINERNNGMIDTLIRARKDYEKVSSAYTDAILVNNHDRNRLISVVNGSLEKHKQAFAILLTLPGTPYIYYGDELGMLGQKPDEMIREPFLWDYADKDTLRTKWIVPQNSTDSTVIPLSAQLNDSQSTINYFKVWIGERNRRPVLQNGDLISISAPDNFLAYSRTLEDERIVILHNLSGEPSEIRLDNLNCSQLVFYVGEKPMLNDKTLIVPPYRSVILK